MDKSDIKRLLYTERTRVLVREGAHVLAQAEADSISATPLGHPVRKAIMRALDATHAASRAIDNYSAEALPDVL